MGALVPTRILPRDSGEGGLKQVRVRTAPGRMPILPRDSGEGGLKLNRRTADDRERYPSPRQRGRRIETGRLAGNGIAPGYHPSPRQRGRRIETTSAGMRARRRRILPRDSGEGG